MGLPRNPCIIHRFVGFSFLCISTISLINLTTWMINGLPACCEMSACRSNRCRCTSGGAPCILSMPASPIATTRGSVALDARSCRFCSMKWDDLLTSSVRHGCMPIEHSGCGSASTSRLIIAISSGFSDCLCVCMSIYGIMCLFMAQGRIRSLPMDGIAKGGAVRATSRAGVRVSLLLRPHIASMWV